MSNDQDLVIPDERVIEAKSKSLLSRIENIKIKTKDDADLVIRILHENRRIINKIKDEFSVSVKSADKSHTDILDLRKKAITKFEEVEELGKAKLENADRSSLGALEGVSFADKWTGEIEDASLIPERFKTPDIDRLKEITSQMKSATKIPGWKAYEVSKVSVRLP